MAEADPKIAAPVSAKIMQPAFAVRLDAFLRVKPFVSDELGRYYLTGIAVQKSAEGGAICAATDGHRLGARRDPDGISLIDVIVSVPRELKMPAKTLLKQTPWLVGMVNPETSFGHISLVEAVMDRDLDTAEKAIENVDECLIRFGRTMIDGQFPDWRKVIPSKAGSSVGFNGDYVKSFGRTLEITGEGPDAPHIVQDVMDPNFIGVIMPVRTKAGSVPTWLAAPVTSA